MSFTHKTHFISLDPIGIKGDLLLIALVNKNIPSSEWDEKNISKNTDLKYDPYTFSSFFKTQR